jgi:TonB dependent receptor/CarboxypepD_reg-like domain/TonB-dependent Receptor Plug Domain
MLLVPFITRADEGTGVLRGEVVIEGGSPAVGANVIVAETRLGATTGNDGSFLVAGIPPGSYRIQVRLLGYVQTESPLIRITIEDTLDVHFVLHQSPIEMNQVTVTGMRRQSAEDVRTSVTSITPRESKILPGAAEDVLRSLQALPGVTSVSDFSSQLVVRGSGPDQNLILIDNFEVLNPYRLYGFVSMFNPETVSDISLQTGGFAAQYGDRLSAVLDVRNREGRSDGIVAGKINASLTNLNIILEGGSSSFPLSYLFSARRTYYDLVLGPILKSMKLVQGDVALPNFRDFQGKVAVPLGGSHKLLFSLFTSRDGVELVSGSERDRPDSVNVLDVAYNTLTGLTWQFNPKRDLILETQLSWYRNNGSGAFDGTFVDPSQNNGDIGRLDTISIRLLHVALSYDYIYEKLSLAQRALWKTGMHTLEAGFGIDRLQTDFVRFFDFDPVLVQLIRARGQVVPTNATETVRYNRAAAYVQDRLALGDQLFVQPGVRLDIFPSLAIRTFLSPRINISFKIDDLSTLRVAYGTYYQSPGMEKQDFRARVIFTEETLHGLLPEHARHYVLGYDRMISPEWQCKVETYLKEFSDLIEPEKLAGSVWAVQRTGASVLMPVGWSTPVRVPSDSFTVKPMNAGTGRSYGIEFMLQKIRTLPTDTFTGWISYALSYAERERDGVTSPFLFDQRHAANLVANYRFAESWDVGFRFTLRSGRPYARALDVQPRVAVVEINGREFPIIQTDSNGKVVLDPLYEQQTTTGRLTLYHTLDVRITNYPHWWGLQWSLYLDVQNVYNRDNQQQMSYYIDDSGSLRERPFYGIPIFPSLGLSIAF